MVSKRNGVLLIVLLTFCVLAFSSSPVQRETNGIVAFITDWGSRDWYVGAVRGVVLSIFPEATMVDISHEVPPFELLEGAATLWFASREFPSGTVFVCVVDPGVGTERRPIVVHTLDNKFFIGPDNGLFTYVMGEYGVKAVYHITNPDFMRHPVSYTFHGRDIFSPAAAYLASGRKVHEVGPVITDYITFDFSAARVEDNKIIGEIMNIDQYGNLRTNISHSMSYQQGLEFGTKIKVTIEGVSVEMPVVHTYGDVPMGDFLAYNTSTDLLAFAINYGNAKDHFNAEIGSEVIVEIVH